jgi:hypothetical protein
MIVGITGFMFSGKDSVADFIMQKTCETMAFRKYSFAKPLKETAMALFGWSEEQVYDQDLKSIVDPLWGISPRQALQYLGTDVMREFFPTLNPEFQKKVGHSFWVKRFQKWYETQPNKNIVIPDVRFPQEVDIIKNLGGIIIRVKRTSVIPRVISHPSEDIDALRGIDIIIDNNGGINDLWTNTEVALKYIKERAQE